MKMIMRWGTQSTMPSLPLQDCLPGVWHAMLGTTPVKQPLQVHLTGDDDTRPAWPWYTLPSRCTYQALPDQSRWRHYSTSYTPLQVCRMAGYCVECYTMTCTPPQVYMPGDDCTRWWLITQVNLREGGTSCCYPTGTPGPHSAPARHQAHDLAAPLLLHWSWHSTATTLRLTESSRIYSNIRMGFYSTIYFW